MPDTRSLDALAELCGYTVAAAAAAASENDADGAGADAGVTSLASRLSNQQQVHDVNNSVSSPIYQQELQMQQQGLTMSHAAVSAAQQHHPIGVPSAMPAHQYADHAQKQKQLQTYLTAQRQHQGIQALAAQLLASQQQQHVTSGVATVPIYHPGLVATLSPAALAGLVASAGVGASQVVTSPSILAMPPPSNTSIPLLPLNHSVVSGWNAAPERCESSGVSSREKQSSSSSMSKLARAKSVAAAPIVSDIINEWEDKKQAKRAANRLSAHMSRKRKKMLIDDLKDENVELRRKEQILRSIPDLIVVFDSSGCISFISHSVERFMGYSVDELEHTSVWNHLTEDSVRQIKSAFMDALSIKRRPEEDSTPLACGESISVTLIPKNRVEGKMTGGEDDQGLLVSLKGVVHFGDEYPECVCSIRPEVSAITKQPVKESLFATTNSNASLSKRQERGHDHAMPVEHQISDIDSDKS
jgi:PAS domain S-box-containing protein